MPFKSILLLLLACCAVGLAVVMLILAILRHKGGVAATRRQTVFSMPGSQRLAGWRSFLLQSYRWSMKLPLWSAYVLQVKKRISFRHVGDEMALRKTTMGIVLIVAGSCSLVGIVLLMVQPGWSFLLLVVLCAVVLNSLVLDMWLNRLEKRLLMQMLDVFAEVRHRYHQHSMIEEALYEAAETGKGEAAQQVMLIYEALTSPDPNEALERYYEAAPNRFLKGFAGMSYLVMEFGDKDRAHGSIYLKGLGNLTQEIHLEILRRDKLDYLLKGLNIIALAPVLFTAPIERWARSSFPSMDEFYGSKLGLVTKISIYVVIIAAYLLLQRLQQYDETRFRAGRSNTVWERILYKQPFIRKCSFLLAAKPGSIKYGQTVRLMRESSSELKYEWLAIRRVVLFVGCFLFSLCCIAALHQVERNHILYAPVRDDRMFGAMSADELKQAQDTADLDRAVLQQVSKAGNATHDEIVQALERVSSRKLKDEVQNETVARITQKWEKLQRQYLQWWELLIAFLIGTSGYYLPIWLMLFQRKMRGMDMLHEIYQFQTVISILRDMERMSVEEILEWLNRFAVIFKRPLQKCLLHFEHGPEDALEHLKADARLPEFQRLVDKLQLALGKISIQEAFDDLDSMMSFYFEQRKQEYANMVDAKAAWGKMIGFAPMYALVFLYLVVPLVGMSFLQMNMYYEQIQQL